MELHIINLYLIDIKFIHLYLKLNARASNVHELSACGSARERKCCNNKNVKLTFSLFCLLLFAGSVVLSILKHN